MKKIDEVYVHYEMIINSSGNLEISSIYYNKKDYYIVSDEETELLKQNMAIMSTPIKEGDTVYFEKGVMFPKLLLNRLQVGVTRIIKRDKADRYIYNDRNLPNKASTKFYRVICFYENTNYSKIIRACLVKNDKISEEDINKYFSNCYLQIRKCIETDCFVKEDNINEVLTNPSKITTASNLVKYINTKLPVPDQTEKQSFLDMFAGSNDDKKLALGMLGMYNVSDMLFEICRKIGYSPNQFENKTKSSIYYKYLQLLIGITPYSLRDAFSYSWSCKGKELESYLYNSEFLSEEAKKKVYNSFFERVTDTEYDPKKKYKFSTYQKAYFEAYNMPIPE